MQNWVSRIKIDVVLCVLVHLAKPDTLHVYTKLYISRSKLDIIQVQGDQSRVELCNWSTRSKNCEQAIKRSISQGNLWDFQNKRE